MIDGDGCSSTCLLEYKIEVKLIYIEKLDSENKLRFKFEISPSHIVNWSLIADMSSIVTISMPS